MSGDLRPNGRRGGPVESQRAFRWTAFALGVTAFGAAISTPLYPEYARDFHFNSGVLGLIFACYTAGVLFTIFFVAPQAERIGRKRLLTAGMLFVALAAFVFAFSSNAIWLGVARTLAGVAVGCTTSVATAAMTDLIPNHDQHHVARVAVAANFGAFGIGAAVSGAIVQLGPDPLQLVYILPVVLAIVGALAVRSTPETAQALGAPARPLVQRISVPPGMASPFWVAAGGLAACYAMYGFFAALMPSYLGSELKISSPLLEGLVVASMFGTAAIVQLATAQIRDRRALLVGFPLLVISLVGLVASLSTASPWPVLLVAPLLGAAVGLTFMGSATLVDRVAPEAARGEVLAGYYAVGYSALAIPTIGVAVTSDQIGFMAAGTLFGSILAVAVAVLLFGIYRTPTPAGGGGRPRDRPAPPVR
ncbi:MAG TPA: MFS transporter [Thermoplasmata archaeon]|nr:MFS transporter [Thermoplasmata archaeon]